MLRLRPPLLRLGLLAALAQASRAGLPAGPRAGGRPRAEGGGLPEPVAQLAPARLLLSKRWAEDGYSPEADQVGQANASARPNSGSRVPPATGASLRGGAAATSSGRMFLLFLTRRGVENPDFWQAFLAGAHESQYRALVHCKSESACLSPWANASATAAVGGRGALPVLTRVRTVPSTYCQDLVTPMVQLLRAAMVESTSARDKFVFLSESMLPVKPFSIVHETLMQDEYSDFCIRAADGWGQLKFGQRHYHLVKHSQWVVLNRAHAQAMVEQWPEVSRGQAELDWSIPVFQDRGATEYPGLGPKVWKLRRHVRICTDEWAFFGTIYGVLPIGTQAFVDDLPGFGPSRRLWTQEEAMRTHQSRCRTLVVWSVDRLHGKTADVVETILEDERTKLSCHPCTGWHPAEFMRISDRSVAALRGSDFLFARKFSAGSMTLDQFRRLILDQRAS